MNKDQANDKAWACLSYQEQQSLALQTSYGKSTREVAEILNITYYKYLELKERSEKFFKMFFEYFSKYDTLIKPNSGLDYRFQSYLEGCIERRIDRCKTVEVTEDSSMYVVKIRTKFLMKQMALLEIMAKENEHDRDLYILIKEFDRWNNWRILPKKLQMPSAYKRRGNRRVKLLMKYVWRISYDKIEIIIDKFQTKSKKDIVWFVVFNEENFDNGYQVIATKNRERTLEILSRLYIYVFADKTFAEMYGFLITEYHFNEKKNSKIGQKFWPSFRETIKEALNFKMINNIDFYTDNLDLAYQNTDKEKLMRLAMKEESAKRGVKRGDESIFNI